MFVNLYLSKLIKYHIDISICRSFLVLLALRYVEVRPYFRSAYCCGFAFSRTRLTRRCGIDEKSRRGMFSDRFSTPYINPVLGKYTLAQGRIIKYGFFGLLVTALLMQRNLDGLKSLDTN